MRPPTLARILEVEGVRTFTTDQAVRWLDRSEAAARAAVRRLREDGAIETPVRGFHVVVREEHRARGTPLLEYLDPLMEHLGEHYAVGSWSAARLHGVEAGDPGQWQVRTTNDRKPIRCEAGRIEFFQFGGSVVETEPERLGDVWVSGAHEVLVELMGHAAARGGLAEVVPVIRQLAPRVNGFLLATAAARAPLTWSARLGYVLEAVGEGDLAGTLRPSLERFLNTSVLLDPRGGKANAAYDDRWSVIVNSDLGLRRA